jgi:hypothetical protein
MPDRKRIDESDLEKVSGGRQDSIRGGGANPDSPIGTPFGDDAIPTGGGSKSRLTPEEAASVSAGRQAPTQPPVNTFDDGDDAPPSVKISPEVGPGASAG